MDLLDTLAEWIDVPSVTGSENAYGDVLARRLAELGFEVERQELAPGRSNVLAHRGEPLVAFCTHQDTVPPWFGARREGDVLFGRGACDAKGQALAQIEAGRRLIESGEDRIGYLFTVGEEIDSAGAQLANERLAAPWRSRYTIVGEPTENEFIRGGKGVFRGTLTARGVAGHSSRPAGPSAIHALVRAIHGMLEDEWGRVEPFGEGTINFGEIEGGVAANVTAASATASVMVRAVEPVEVVEERMRRHLGKRVELEVYKSYGPIDFHVPEGHEGGIVTFGTDAPYIDRWGTLLLYGPGSIEDAHTADEKIEKDELVRAVEELEVTTRSLLDQIDSGR